MNISEEAIEAAAFALCVSDCAAWNGNADLYRRRARAALEAAVPFIGAAK